MKLSIFRQAKDVHEKSERHRVIHWVWKTKIFYPLMWFMERKIKKYLVKSIEDIPNEIYDRNFKILYYSVEKGIENWWYTFYGGIHNGKIYKPKYDELKAKWPDTETCHWRKTTKFFLNLLVTICLEDTAYRELINQIMFEIQGEMNRIYNPKIKHKFPMYMSLYETYLPFFIEWMRIQGGGRVLMDVPPNPPNIKKPSKERKSILLSKNAVDIINEMDEKKKEKFKTEISQFIIRITGK